MRGWRLLAGVVLGGLAGAAAAQVTEGPPERPSVSWVTRTAERDGLVLRAEIVQAHGAIAVETRLENRRSEPAGLVPDQCGRVTESVVRRTRLDPTGHHWDGSAGALKRLVLRRQVSRQKPESLAPRRPGESSSAVPDCERPRGRVRLAPGGTIRERWELRDSRTLDAVGSARAAVQVSAVEAGPSDTTELLDLRSDETARRRRARTVRIEAPVAAVLSRLPAPRAAAAVEALQFDALLADARLRDWIEAQPAASWRDANLSQGRLWAVTARYERAATATLRGGRVTVTLPGPADRARRFATRAAELPPGVRVVRDKRNATPTRDVMPGPITLPSGRLVVEGDGFYAEAGPVEPRVAPGRYPVHITLARFRRSGGEIPALAGLHVSRRRIVRWRRAGAIGTDGATGGFTSAEGAAAYRRLGDDWEAWSDVARDSEAAHGWQATRILPLGERTDAIQFSTGAGDGGYPLYVGLDAQGRAARFVLDFGLIHLAWHGR